MGRLWQRLRAAWQGPIATRIRGRRPRKPGLDALEARVAMAVDVAIDTVEPQILTPVNNRLVPVVVSGFAVSTRPGNVPFTRFQVIDEYRQFEPSGRITLERINADSFRYSFTVNLPASKGTNDSVGRQFNILVITSDQDNAAGKYKGVIVPGEPVVKQNFEIPAARVRRARASR